MDSLISSLMRIVEFFFQLLNPSKLEALLYSWGWVGYPILFAIIFSETGLLLGFCLPGDSLLFIAGFVASTDLLNIYLLNILLIVAAIVGDSCGYYLGKKTGPRVFNREDSFFFHKAHLIRTQEFYKKHGGKTIVLARFIPIIRTFAPFVAGMASMPYSRFAFYNIFGGIGWVTLMTTCGYFLGNIPIIRRNFEKTVLVIIFLSILPLIWHGIRSRKTR